MDPMCMEAALCSPIAVASISTSQVYLSTVRGVNSSSQVVPLTSGEGGYVAVWVDPSAYKSRLEVSKYILIGRVVLSSGEKPWKLVDLKAKLQFVWKLNSAWRLISLDKGYFQIMLNSDVEKNMVWVRFYDLSWEYWLSKIVSDLARGIGVPLRLDRATVKAFCSTCSSIGHLPNACRWNKSGKVIHVNSSKPDSVRDGSTTIVVDEGFQIPQNYASKLVYRPISSTLTEVPVSNVFAAIQQDLGSLDSIVVHSSAGSDPVLSMGSSTSVVAVPSLTSSVCPTISVVVVQALPVIDLWDQTVPTIMGPFSPQRPLILHTAHEIVLFHEQQLTISITVNSRLHYFTFVYTSTSTIVQRSLWQSLRDMASLVSSSWLVMGDFNVVLRAHESLGLHSPARSSCEDFKFLDHCPLVIRLSDIVNFSPRHFRFQSIWLDHPDFMALFHRIWSSSDVGNPPQMVVNKLNRLKNALKTWNWEVFGDLNSKISGKSAELQSIHIQMSNMGFLEKLFMAESRVHHELDVLLRRQECFYLDR
ncbi:hypothetical protein Ddye_016114 [Dipteronia dyeriana]|uniref:DUF4283 domain-containing protein n=1 Tax=Dipteronia dyeriana TaxID=168575 RepID=A0AAD9U6Z0_9ROSI|nr:hypothetical protein Ddye_016114 [Dipteronia dyeriana]